MNGEMGETVFMKEKGSSIYGESIAGCLQRVTLIRVITIRITAALNQQL